MVDIGGGSPAMDAESAVKGEHLLTTPPPGSAPRTAELAPIAPAPSLDQAAAADAGAQH